MLWEVGSALGGGEGALGGGESVLMGWEDWRGERGVVVGR